MYVLGAIGQTRLAYPQAATDASIQALPATFSSLATNNPSAYKLQLGYKLDERWSLEGGYTDLGRVSYQATGTTTGATPFSASESVKVTAWNLNANAAFPLTESFSMLGKVGITRVELTDTATATSTLPGALAKLWLTSNTIKTGLTYGLGLKLAIDKSFLVRADVDSYDTGVSTGRIQVWTIGLGYHF
jgi:opacity protein-like surface antigen